MSNRGPELDKRGDYIEQQADALLEAANIATDIGEIEKAIAWQREAGELYGQAAALAHQASEAYRAGE